MEHSEEILTRKNKKWKKIEWAYNAAFGSLSLDYKQENEGSLAQSLVGSDLNKTDEKIEAEIILKIARKVLTPRRYRILIHHFGFNDGVPKTFKQTSEHYKFSVQWAHYIIGASIKRLRPVLMKP